ncbi:unnamed protein product [Peronospora destructor]|uniref:Protein kinase domain-containing protein n=1 Tax=Peronospora destructor TaxID=86335 RepID=A0AAV0V1Z2_9STRA|nr:unnamed protein product [Peronospora destructor]
MTQHSVARVYSVMQELQQLRDKNRKLSEKNVELAKALTATKQELTKARVAQKAVFSDKVLEWMEARHKPVEGKTYIRSSSAAKPVIFEIDPMGFEQDKATDSFTKDNAYAVGSKAKDDGYIPNRVADSRNSIAQDVDVAWLGHEAMQRQRTMFSPVDSKQTSLQRLRQRDASVSYVEPKLNVKLRRGDYYGLGKRISQPKNTCRMAKHREGSKPRRSNAAFSSSPFGQQFSPFRRRRPVQRISYAEPKLNTKLRQDVVNGNAQVHSNGEKNVTARGKSVPAVVNSNSFEEQYTVGKVVGSGTFSVVRVAVHKPTSQRYAIKCIKRDGLVAEDIEALTTEIAILKQINHPNIMILHDFFVEEKFYYLVTEFMEGGELFDRIVEKSYYNEREARDLVKLLLEAIKYCHDAAIVHRDLKPENLLLTSKDDDASIKLADFGFAKKVEFDTEGLVTACGTPGYVAPEILEGRPYGKTVDIWSIGVITYILLCGYPPFHDDNHNALFKKIKEGKFQFDSPYWDHVSDDAKDLISQMLVVDPEKRATVDQLLAHRWVTGTEIATVQLTSALEELRRFNARRKFKAAVSTVSTTVGFSKKFSQSYSHAQSSLDEAADVDFGNVPETVDKTT